MSSAPTTGGTRRGSARSNGLWTGTIAVLILAALIGAACDAWPSEPEHAALDAGSVLGAPIGLPLDAPAAFATAAVPAARRPDPGPNVLLIVVDTLRADRVSFAGYERPTTPALDRFAADAVVFRNAWSPSCWTPPAHLSLFTGMRPERHRSFLDGHPSVPEAGTLLAETLSARGFRTSAFVNNPLLQQMGRLFTGFERVTLPWVEMEVDPSVAATSADTTKRMLATIRQHRRRGERFFVFANLFEPHLPYAPAPAAAASFVSGRPREQVTAARALTMAQIENHSYGARRLDAGLVDTLSDLYDAEISTTSAAIGTLLDALRSDGTLDETLVIVTSDHGEEFDEHGRLGHMHQLNSALLRIPLLVRLPGAFDGGRVCEDVVRLEDVTATILEITGLPVADDLDGQSLTSDLPGRIARAAVGENEILTAARTRRAPQSTVRFGPTRSVVRDRFHLIAAPGVPPRLFDVVADPREQIDLAESHPDEVRRLSELIVW